MDGGNGDGNGWRKLRRAGKWRKTRGPKRRVGTQRQAQSVLPWTLEQPTSGSHGEPQHQDDVMAEDALEESGVVDERFQSLDPGLNIDLHERMVPTEAELVFISQDRRELHYIVPLRRVQLYHTRYRDFVVVGFRLLRCSESGNADRNVVVGWCNAERQCCEPAYRRAMFPESDLDFSTDTTGFGPLCECAGRLHQHLGGDENVRLLLNGQDDTVHFQTDGKPRVREEWRVARHDYVIVNLNKEYDLVFNQWGVSKLNNEGYTCQMCTSKPRHCAHNKALLGISDGEVIGPRLSRKEVAERSISKLLDETKKFKPPCISRETLPFFSKDDADVNKHCEG